MKSKSLVKVLLFASFILLSACSTVQTLKPVANPSMAWKAYVIKVSAVKNWTAQGQLGISNANQAISANFIWQQTANSFIIRLAGPLNIGEQILQGSPGQISLHSGNDQIAQADNAEDLMQQQLGWSMPVEGLVYWIRALPVLNLAYTPQIDPNGTLASLKQQGWTINYRSYTVVNGLPLPHKLIMQQGSWRIIVVINQWSIK